MKAGFGLGSPRCLPRKLHNQRRFSPHNELSCAEQIEILTLATRSRTTRFSTAWRVISATSTRYAMPCGTAAKGAHVLCYRSGFSNSSLRRLIMAWNSLITVPELIRFITVPPRKHLILHTDGDYRPSFFYDLTIRRDKWLFCFTSRCREIPMLLQ
jgi:hypothetical protein